MPLSMLWLDRLLDHWIYPSPAAVQRTFQTYNVGGTECLVVTREDATCWLIYCHGNLVTLDSLYHSGVPRQFVETCKCNFVAPAYPSTHLNGAAHDACIVEAVRCAYEQIRTDSTAPVYLVGHSLGVGVALGAGRTTPPAGLVLVSGFSSIRAMAPRALWYVIPDRFNNAKAIRQYTCDKVVIHGSKDAIVPVANATALATAGAATLRILDMGHNPNPIDWSAIYTACACMIGEGGVVAAATYPVFAR